jgi:hypothetical protein
VIRDTHVQKTIALLRANKHRRVPLPDIQRAAGAQHGTRLKEIRSLGYVIANETERTSNGETHSFYILRAEPDETVPANPPPIAKPEPNLKGTSGKLFPGLEPSGFQYPD